MKSLFSYFFQHFIFINNSLHVIISLPKFCINVLISFLMVCSHVRVGVIKMELAQQIKADFEESFQGPNAKVWLTVLLFISNFIW